MTRRVYRDGAWIEAAKGDYRVGDRLPFLEGFEYEVTHVGPSADGVPEVNMKVVHARERGIGGYQRVGLFDRD
ncbi:MAG: hypothetical protein WC683_01055 [bacterium]